NRTSMSETDVKTSYTYDVLDRLVEAKELNNSQAILKTYDYDKRGNQTKEFINGLLQKAFTFDATNMLSKVVDKDKGELENFYNGLGFRVASVKPEERIEYLCDLSRDYYNLLERTVNGETESFVYDNNVISMSKAGNNLYYLQDELGSPMYMTGTDGAVVSAYAFDDFGRNIDPFTGKRRDKNHKHAYTTNGNIIQPFAFTGYQEDEVSGLKFAQARFYSADNGRFLGEDQIKGFIDNPESQNHFEYCRQNPIEYIDIDGKCPLLATAAIGVGIGALVGGGATVVSSLVKGEEINWKKVAKNAGKGALVGGALGLGFVGASAVAAETAAAIGLSGANLTAVALGTTGVTAGIGAAQGAIGSAVTGGNALNGALSGAINASISMAVTVATGNPYIGNFIGGAVGSLTSDAFDHWDNPQPWNGKAVIKRALLAGFIQAAVTGTISDGATKLIANPVAEVLPSNIAGLVFGMGVTLIQAATSNFFPVSTTNIDNESACGEG
uniref:RHS repeat-associated core domain-containing protein n=1 Tax=Butyrivibrio sp. LB2008 TaxID=1408305 RepID=UPI0005686509